ncbi:TonB-dependent hemoglobin/transferrin/lactoferrin family receptor [Pasteurellaceae bacterium HPA106]|uniref:TonB-dependent hemoglobin/transferrin/lactoferrin family receptor n=1 Tax=Spirabiliibacterium pneumoniae TaxID=221400 RepID=UPI001AAD4884|nr:TonB-dependent hemoglobin/transferrin/lactoferrin family receptor [Spirabiliibacterium pneumoniae]MBE2896104.1 TonB-dependent hemoglobin/transferrin/lactoferrin family receptor [Spirabiliibacterium pneumoniae]
MQKRFSLSVISTALLLTFAAHADDQLDTIVVQGEQNKQAEQLNEKLGEVSTTRAQLDRTLTQDIHDMVRYNPSVSVVEGGRAGSNGFSIRGVDKDRVAINVDGLPQAESRSSSAFQELFGAYGNFNSNRNAAELENISTITIKKGADSLTSGSGALGGAVNYETKKAQDFLKDKPYYLSAKGAYSGKNREWMRTVTAAGQYNGFDALAVLTRRDGHEVKNHSQGSDEHITSPDRVYNPTGGSGYFGSVGTVRGEPDPQHYHAKSGLVRLGYHFNDHNYVNALYEDYRKDSYTKEYSNLWSANWQGKPSNELRKRNDVSYRQRYGVEFENTLTQGLWDKLNVSFNHQQINMDTMSWDMAEDMSKSPSGINSEVYYIYRNIKQTLDQGKLSAEKLLAFDNWLWQIKTGVSAGRSRNENENLSYFVRAFAPSIKTTNTGEEEFLIEAKSSNRSVFWDNTFLIGEKLKLSAGVRYDWIKSQPLANDKFIKAMADLNLLNRQAKFQAISQGVSFSYQLPAGFNLLGKYSSGFRAPTTDEIWFNFPHPDFYVKANPELKAEKSHNLELGLAHQSEWGYGQLSGFYTRYNNFIDFAYLGKQSVPFWNPVENDWRKEEAPTYQNINRRKAEVAGVEFNGRLELAPFGAPQGLYTALNASYTKGRQLHDTGVYIPLNELDPFSGTLGLGYQHPDDKWSVATHITYTAGKKAQDTFHSDDDIYKPWPYASHSRHYTTVDLNGHYKLNKHLTLRAGVFNLFNQRYYTWNSLRSIREFGTVNRIDNKTHAGIGRFTAPGRYFSFMIEATF